MKRVLIAVTLLTALLTALIGLRIRAAQRAESAAPGGSGVVESEGVDVSARMSARVAHVLVAEGAQVSEGAPLVELVCDEPRARLAEAEARVLAARAQAEAALAQARAAGGQRAAAAANIDALGAQIGALDAQHQVAAREAARFDAMAEHAAVSARDRARAQADGLAEQERAARASQRASRKQAAAASDQAEAARAQAEAARASAIALEAAATSARIAVEECSVRAPRAGVVERVYYDPGELVPPSGVVARVVDPRVVSVIFYLPNTDVDEARVGARATVRADAYEDQHFEGIVRRVALEAEFTPRNVQTRSDRDRLVFPVEVRVAQHAGRLRAGMPVTVTLEGDRP